jgi:ubiquinone/menaquinone biosynthesis C-methylase UbiE
MTWEETIIFIRTKPEYQDLVEKAYFHEDLEFNVRNFGNSLEFKETLAIINKYAPNAQRILDIGCGNGISAINFALKEYQVYAVEPDASITIGAGAIKKIKEQLHLDNIEIYEEFAEDIKFESNSFDIVYVRQAVHHSKDLIKFIGECLRVLKPGGLLLTIRDHVIFDESDKQWFLKSHPLHKFYGGENAFTREQYKKAMTLAGGTIIKELKYYESVLNYFPETQESLEKLVQEENQRIRKKLKNKLGSIGTTGFMFAIYKMICNFHPLNEKKIPGRMYSYIVIKQ